MCYICLFVILFTLYFRSEYNTNNTNNKIENMSNASDIKAQINKIYKSDIQSIRNLAEISEKLQKGGLEIPGALTIKGKLTANNIQSNTLVSLKNSLETKLNALQSKLTTLTNQSNSKFNNINQTLGKIGDSTKLVRHQDTITIRSQKKPYFRLQNSQNAGYAQFNNHNKAGWEKMNIEKCGHPAMTPVSVHNCQKG